MGSSPISNTRYNKSLFRLLFFDMTKLSIKHTQEGWTLINAEGQTHVVTYPSKIRATAAMDKVQKGLIHFQPQVGQFLHQYHI